MGRVVVDEDCVEVVVGVGTSVLVDVVVVDIVVVDGVVVDVVVEVVVVVDEVEDEVVDVVVVDETTPLVVNASSGTISQPASLIFQANIKQVSPPAS